SKHSNSMFTHGHLPHQTKVSIALVAAIVTTLASAAYPTSTLADRFDSSSYSIQFGNFNVTSGEKSSSNYKVTDTVGQTGAGPYGQYGTNNYIIGGGFQYIYPLRDFEFSISSVAIDLGLLVPGIHSSRSHTLTVTTRGASGYKIYAFADHSLRRQNGVTIIPHTTCDAGSCTTSSAQLWSNQTIPGFGYNMTGQDIPVDFATSNYFRPFADKSLGQPMQVVMSSSALAFNNTSTITYKAGVPGSQASGTYNTTVSFVAVPGY
ncbi:hypothetical protein KA012_04370, partial [Candidatus Woesebacteria bacterium]|nr:hypothetical protein [Candidatus Woesebacteria bacterium]